MRRTSLRAANHHDGLGRAPDSAFTECQPRTVGELVFSRIPQLTSVKKQKTREAASAAIAKIYDRVAKKKE